MKWDGLHLWMPVSSRRAPCRRADVRHVTIRTCPLHLLGRALASASGRGTDTSVLQGHPEFILTAALNGFHALQVFHRLRAPLRDHSTSSTTCPGHLLQVPLRLPCFRPASLREHVRKMWPYRPSPWWFWEALRSKRHIGARSRHRGCRAWAQASDPWLSAAS